MIRKVVILLAGIAVSIGLLAPIPLAAQTSPSATRSLDATVAPGGSLEVMITAEGHGTFADVVETLPDGFTYETTVSLGAEDVSVSGQVATGQVVTFTLFGTTSPTTFTYTVTASDVAIEHTFSGDFSGVNASNDPFSGVDVVGDSTVTVEAGTTPTPEPTAEPTASPTPGSISATRSFDAFDETLVAPGEQVEVRITAQGHGTFADVVETLPAGFTYVSSSLDCSSKMYRFQARSPQARSSP